MVRKCWPGHRAQFEVFLDFEDITRLEYNDDPDQLEKIFCMREEPGKTLPLQCGFFSYELLAANMGIQCRSPIDLNLPAALWARPQTRLVLMEDHVSVETCKTGQAKQIQELALKCPKPAKSPSSNAFGSISSNLTETEYAEIFQAAREQILDGNTYQIKISQRFESRQTLNPFQAFARLSSTNPSPEAFLLCWDDFSLVSCSPETVLHKQEANLITRPIGGTFEKMEAGWEENRVREFLGNNKELAEHNMLVDLERNDLSRVCKSGSVRISRFREVEKYAHLYHLVTTIEGMARDDVGIKEILRAMLPGGTVTGCPKYSTIELIDRFEPCFRGPYTGSFGTLHDNGDMHLNLIIRALIQVDGRSLVQAGGGIVIDSNPAYEFNENRIKAQALLNLLNNPADAQARDSTLSGSNIPATQLQ